MNATANEIMGVTVKQQLQATSALFACCALILAMTARAGGAQDTFATWAAAHAAPISTVDLTNVDSDLLPIKSAIGTAHVVALGEPLHGAHEPLAFRNRLFRFLVQRMGFTAIAVEAGFPDLADKNACIQNSKSEAPPCETSDFDGYLENRELVQWMRDYNAAATSSKHRKISLYGINLPGDARPTGPRLALEHALTFLSIADPKSARTIRSSLSDNLPKTDGGGFSALSPDAQSEFEVAIRMVAQSMLKNRKSLISRSSEQEYQWALHNLDTARQLARCIPLTPTPSAGPDPWIPAFDCRDSAMASNVRWAVEQEGSQGRLLIFAHNGHVMNWKEEGPRWAGASSRPSMMGLYLRHLYGTDLYIIATSSASTTGELPQAKTIDTNSIEHVLGGLGLPLLFLDIRGAGQNTDALAWLSSQRSMNANIYIDFRLTPSSALDALTFIRTLTPAIQSPEVSH